jgi:integrase
VLHGWCPTSIRPGSSRWPAGHLCGGCVIHEPSVQRTRAPLGASGVSTHSFRKTVATLIDDEGVSARIGTDHLGQAKVSMTQNV